MAVGKIGAVTAVPDPGSRILKTALDVMAAAGAEGGAGTMRDLLGEIHAAQEANEAVYEQVAAAAQELSKSRSEIARADSGATKRLGEAAAAEAANAEAFTARERIVAAAERALRVAQAAFAQEKTDRTAEMDARDGALRETARVLDNARQANEASDAALNVQATALATREANMQTLTADLRGILARVGE